MKKLTTLKLVTLVVFLGFTMATGSCESSNNNMNEIPDPKPEKPEDPTALNYIFESGTAGYFCFRIPAIVKTTDGTLLAFSEARKGSCSDEGDIDLVVKRSTDGGETWGRMITVFDQGENTVGNPVPVIDEKTGRIHLLMSQNVGEDTFREINDGTSKDTRRVFYTWSDDNGLTWREPEEITSSVKKSDWAWYDTGPVHGIQLREGKYKGRLVIPCDFITKGPNSKGYSHIIFSDDNGKTWQLGGVVPQAGTGESTVAELSNGNLMLNMRSNDSLRFVATSSDGGKTFGQAYLDDELKEPTCQGSLLSCEINGSHRLFFSNPANSADRVNMTIKMSTDDGDTWPQSYTVYSGPSAYSDIVKVTDDEIGILYEAGKDSPYEGIAYENIPLKKIE